MKPFLEDQLTFIDSLDEEEESLFSRANSVGSRETCGMFRLAHFA
jgi:hypothetical protein